MGHSIFLKFYFMTHMIYVIVFVLRNHYLAGENNRMSHQRSLIFFEIRFYDSYESFRLLRDRFQLFDFNYRLFIVNSRNRKRIHSEFA